MNKIILACLVFSSVVATAGSATYEVPTSQAALKASSVFNLEKLTFAVEGDVTKVRYQVPQELTGILNELEFAGALKQGSGLLHSDKGFMNCLANNFEMMCSVSYQKIEFDLPLAKSLLAEKFQGDELARRLDILEKFVIDPIGIIRIRY